MKDKNETWIFLDKKTEYVGVGIYIKGELETLDINVIQNPKWWGVSVVGCDDEGPKKVFEIASYDDDYIAGRIEIFDMEITVTVFKETNGFTVSVMY